MERMRPALLLLALAVPLAAQEVSVVPAAEDIPVEREELVNLGWRDSCSAALKHQVYPAFGAAIHGEPISTRLGTVSLEPGIEAAETKWFYEASGAASHDAKRIARFESDLAKLGYKRKGYAEAVRPEVSDRQPGLADTLLTTATLRLRPGLPWPGAGWRWSGADFFPLGTCALLTFDSVTAPPRKDWRLVRVYNPRARLERSRAHATNARLLFAAGELETATAEAGTAASLAPESALARYVHATLLAMSGRDEEAVAELKVSIELDPGKRREARRDRDFETLRPRQDFRDLVGSNVIDRLSREGGTDSVIR